jgi:hypothetical protein
MLRASAEIKFTLKGKDYFVDKYPLRPVFSFGDKLLFSGDIKSACKEYLYNHSYTVDIEFFTIEDEAYAAVRPKLKDRMSLTICAGRQIIGMAKAWNFTYEN